MRLSPETLTIICESIALKGSFAAAARDAAVSQSTLFKWIADSRRDADARLETSPLFFTWRERADFLSRHIVRAKSEGVMSLLYSVIDETRNGIAEVCYDPATSRPIQKLVALTAHRPREWFEAQGLDYDVDRYEWTRDAITDEILEPIYQTKTVHVPASLRQKVLSGVLPKTFGDKVAVNHDVSGQVVHTIAPPVFVSRRSAEPVIDAQFSEVVGELPAPPTPEQRPDVQRLREQFSEIMANPNRRTKPDNPAAVPVYGRNEGDAADKLTTPSAPRPAAEHARAYTRPTMAPTPTRPPSAYPAGTDPRGRVAVKVR